MFRFTIRELLLLTVIVAMGAGWCVEYRRRDLAESDSAMLRAEINLLAIIMRHHGFNVKLDADGRVVAANKPGPPN